MKKFLKIFGRILLVVMILAACLLAYVKFFLPDVGAAPSFEVERTAARVARGKYLANSVTICVDCHSQRDWTKFSGPIKPGTEGMGGELFDQQFGFPGKYYAKNITPAGISKYTDGELFRVITTGVSKDKKAMFPVMPYHNYGRMDDEDIKSIIAYLRTLPATKNDVPESESDFPMNFIINTIPAKASLTKRPAESDLVNYGKYMVNAAACIECHTQVDKGELIKGTEYGGGREFPFPDGSLVRSGNISPHKATGIGNWSEQQFIEMFRTRGDSSFMNASFKPGDVNTIMPWTMYGKMTDQDLKAIYAYLRTVPAINNPVQKFVKKAAK